MFPSISKEIGLEQCRKHLDKRNDPIFSTDCITDALEITLDNNFAEFEGETFRQIKGTAMGPKNACAYADTAIDKLDHDVLNGSWEHRPILWARFRDDVYVPWTHGQDRGLKWTLKVNKTTSNAAVWGDTGRYLLAVELSSQLFSYWDRLNKMEKDDASCLVRHAFSEQKNLNLSWHKNIEKARVTIKKESKSTTGDTPNNLKMDLQTLFQQQWNYDRANNKKFEFYNTVKTSFGIEKYLLMNISTKKRKVLAKFRSSSHSFNIETGRHGASRRHIINRICKNCSTQDQEVLYGLAEMPFFDPIIEDEVHVLRTCSLYEDLRHCLSQSAKTSLLNNMEYLFMEPELIKELTKFLNEINKRRFGED